MNKNRPKTSAKSTKSKPASRSKGLSSFPKLGLRKKQRAGISLIEMLVAVAVVAALVVMALFALNTQLSRSRDARRKADIEKIQVAFEDYYNDNNCYPPQGALDTCNGTELSPYLAKIPCDPSDKEPYTYVPLVGNECGGYRLFARLENTNDPVIASLGCDGSCGCGYGASKNYGASEGVPLVSEQCEAPDDTTGTPQPTSTATPAAPQGSPTPTPVPTPTATPTIYACDPGNPQPVCNVYSVPPAGCVTFTSLYGPEGCIAKCGESSANVCNPTSSNPGGGNVTTGGSNEQLDGDINYLDGGQPPTESF